MRKLTHALAAALVIMLLADGAPVGGLQNASEANNGLEPIPLLGWSSWSFLRENPTAAKLEAQARAMQDSGLQKIGYAYINLDDFWYQCPGPQGPNVDSYGRWVTDPVEIPTPGRYKRHQGSR